jgi:hypothetical protein
MEKASHKMTVITGLDSMLCIQKICGPYQKSCTNKFHNQVKVWRGKQHISQVCALRHFSTKSCPDRRIYATVSEVWKSHRGGRTPSKQFANKDGQLLGVSHWLHNVASCITFYKPEQMVVCWAYAHTVQWMGRSYQPFFWILTTHTDEQCETMCCHAAGLFFFFPGYVT